MKASNIKYLIIHCSDSKWGNADEIRRWHTMPKPKGNGWADIGYHYVICNEFPTYFSEKNNKPITSSDGKIEKGREDNVAGAHARGFNSNSLGICLVGRGREDGGFTEAQITSLITLIHGLKEKYRIPTSHILGHYETPLSHGKTCPNMNMTGLRYLLNITPEEVDDEKADGFSILYEGKQNKRQ